MSGSGGAPLTMREVEELEKMTKDFIKDMDKHPPVITSPATGTQTHYDLTYTPILVYTPTPLRFDWSFSSVLISVIFMVLMII